MLLTEACALRIGLRALLEGLVGDGLVAHQLLAAREIGFGEGEIRFRLRQIGARLIERVLERPLVDGEQQIALLDDLPVLEMHAVEIAGDARAHLDRIDRGEAADIFVEIGDRALDRLGDGDRRRRRRAALLVAPRRSLRPKLQARTAKRCSRPPRITENDGIARAEFMNTCDIGQPRIARTVPIASAGSYVHRARSAMDRSSGTLRQPRGRARNAASQRGPNSASTTPP